jgi:starch synthase
VPLYILQEPSDVELALGRAIDAYCNGQSWWQEHLVPTAMQQDWSWSRSAQDYLNIYRSI